MDSVSICLHLGAFLPSNANLTGARAAVARDGMDLTAVEFGLKAVVLRFAPDSVPGRYIVYCEVGSTDGLVRLIKFALDVRLGSASPFVPAPKGSFSVSDGMLIIDGGEFSVSDGILIIDGGEFSVSDGVLITDGGTFSVSDGELVDVTPAAAFTFSPTALAFPATDPSSAAELTVTVTNTGDAAGTITDFSVTGDAYSADLVS
ncbi:hypothetical protein ACRC7T_18100 [Segnochrobactraceae bacterium EtOH-i3]